MPLTRDHKKEWQDWLDRIKRIQAHVEKIPGVKGETHIEPGPANAFPSLLVTWNQKTVKMTATEAQSALQKGTPSIVANVATKDNKQVLSIGVVLLKPEQVDIVARRLKEILQHAV